MTLYFHVVSQEDPSKVVDSIAVPPEAEADMRKLFGGFVAAALEGAKPAKPATDEVVQLNRLGRFCGGMAFGFAASLLGLLAQAHWQKHKAGKRAPSE